MIVGEHSENASSCLALSGINDSLAMEYVSTRWLLQKLAGASLLSAENP